MSDELPVDEQPLPEQPTDPKEDPPTDPPADPPTDPPVDPPAEPKRKILVKLKGADLDPIEVEEDAKTVSLPIEEFEVFVPPTPEVWDNITEDRLQIVNGVRALVMIPYTNKPIGFLMNDDEKYVWVDGGLQVQKRQQR